jgi:hypothetical protein
MMYDVEFVEGNLRLHGFLYVLTVWLIRSYSFNI